MTEIARGDGQRYAISYDPYRNLEAVKIGSTSLVTYGYKSSAGKLKRMTYANGDYMTATYNSFGQLVTEKWFDSADTLVSHYKYIYDNEGNIVRSLDILSGKEYNYIYEKGIIARANECNITDNGKTVVSTVFYTYDKDGKLVKKRVMSQSGEVRTYTYETPEEGNAVLRFEANGKTVTSHSKTDSFGRKVFEELQLGKGFVSRQFTYLSGETTEEHSENGKLKSSPTTLLVKSINFDNGRIVSYEYDAEERITKVTDSIDGITEYTYDSLGQLLTEKHNNTVVNAMTYDNYGNIKTKNGVAYTYGNSSWKDLLTKVGDKTISYDSQGNPLSYLGHTLTWEKGRQLKSFDSNTYTYNANGIRTSKTVNGITHTYTLDGTKILKECWENNTLIPLYDNEDTVCGIEYNGTSYWFYKNLQGDIISIANSDGDVIAKYTYDAWGKPISICDVNGNAITDNSNIAIINPYRYRGYYYDTEIGMYYLQSRYYDPTGGRFINGDNAVCLITDNTSNLFVYCQNNPVNQKDDVGYIAANIIGAAIGAVIGVVGGVFLGNWLADLLKLSGWKRWIFVGGVSVLVGAAAAVIGYFIGPYVAKIATKLGQYIANLIRKGKIVFKKLSSNVKASMRTLFKETCCFVAGTHISTPNGEKAIEEISVGDSVYSSNPETGEVGIKKVLNIFKKQADILYYIIVNGEEIITTAEHPFWVRGKGWVPAYKLTSEDELCLQSGAFVKVNSVFVKHLSSPVFVYNFEVEEWHTYFVGSNRVLVHNKCSLTKLGDKYLKQNGLNAHSIKYELLGKKANIARYNLYYDKATGAIFLLENGAKEVAKIATGYFIK